MRTIVTWKSGRRRVWWGLESQRGCVPSPAGLTQFRRSVGRRSGDGLSSATDQAKLTRLLGPRFGETRCLFGADRLGLLDALARCEQVVERGVNASEFDDHVGTRVDARGRRLR